MFNFNVACGSFWWWDDDACVCVEIVSLHKEGHRGVVVVVGI